MSTNGGDSNGSSIDAVYQSARWGSVIYLCIVGVCGIIANSLVIFVFWKYPKLRTATNLFILNLAFCDLMLSILDNSMSIASTLNGKWLFGRGGCVAYGFFHYFFICCTISTLAAISVDRFFFITRPSQTRAVQVITRKKAIGILLIIYSYTVLFTFPPCVGWNSFVEEKYFYSGCYINYGDQKSSSIGYSVIASFFLFLVPLTFMIYCYARIFVAVRRSTHRTIDRSLGTASSLKKRHPLFKRTHVQTAKMIVVVIFFSMVVWVPYTLVSLIKAANGDDLIAPLVSHITVLVAKSCVIYNVLIYAILNRKLKAAILDVICCGRQSFSLVGSPSPGGGTTRNRISRILSETEAPSHVIEAQRNRLSALTIQQSSEQLNEENVSTPHSATRPKNGVVKNVEFRVDQRKDSVIVNEELPSGESLAFENDNSKMDEQFVHRKRLSKITRNSDTIEGSHIVGNGFPINQIESVTPEKQIALEQGVNDTESRPIYFNSRDSTSRRGERKDAHQIAGSHLSSLSTGAGAGSFQRVHHLYSSGSGARNKKTVSTRNALSTLSSPSQLYKKGTRPVSTQHVSKRISPDSGCAQASTSTDQESDLSRGHSREGSVVKRSITSTPRHREDPRKARSVNKVGTNGRYQPTRRKSHRRSSCADPLQTSPQELLAIQNYWKRMSLCLDDIDLD